MLGYGHSPSWLLETMGKDKTISYDEFFHIENAKKRLKYLFSLGIHDYSSVLHLKYYPGLYDTLSSLIISAFPKNYENEFHHVLNFLVGISGIFA